MTPLPRGTCPVCFAEVALRKGDLIREHRGDCLPLPADPTVPGDFGGFLCGTACGGSGLPSVESAGRGDVCAYCGGVLPLRRRVTQRYCRAYCRVLAFRDRHGRPRVAPRGATP